VVEWIVTPPADPRAFPLVRHQHPNGTLDTVWSFRCPCGATYVLERPR
jgi:hypothetical protein